MDSGQFLTPERLSVIDWYEATYPNCINDEWYNKPIIEKYLQAELARRILNKMIETYNKAVDEFINGHANKKPLGTVCIN